MDFFFLIAGKKIYLTTMLWVPVNIYLTLSPDRLFKIWGLSHHVQGISKAKNFYFLYVCQSASVPTPSQNLGMLLKLNETNISTKHNMLKNPNGLEHYYLANTKWPGSWTSTVVGVWFLNQWNWIVAINGHNTLIKSRSRHSALISNLPTYIACLSILCIMHRNDYPTNTTVESYG